MGPFRREMVTKAALACLKKLEGNPDLVIAFVSSDFQSNLSEFLEILQIDGHASRIIGGTGAGLLGVNREASNYSGFSLFCMRFPRTDIECFVGTEHDFFRDIVTREDPDACFVLGHPLRKERLGELIDGLNTYAPGVVTAGGWVTGGPAAEDVFFFTENGPCDSELMAVRMRGGVRIVSLLSQGCRPIGEPLVITEADHDRLIRIAGEKPFEVLQELYAALDQDLKHDKDYRICAGVAASEVVDEFRSGHFVVEQIIGGNLNRGQLKLSAPVRPGQTMQFLISDPQAAAEDLMEKLTLLHGEYGVPLGALLCRDRLRGSRNKHPIDGILGDSAIFHEVFGKISMSGLLTFGEIGPTCGATFHHVRALSGLLFYDMPEEAVGAGS
jgi:small ligand-binding sensory domain FIST